MFVIFCLFLYRNTNLSGTSTKYKGFGRIPVLQSKPFKRNRFDMQFFICVLVNGKNQVKEYCQSFIRSQRLPSSSESPLGI